MGIDDTTDDAPRGELSFAAPDDGDATEYRQHRFVLPPGATELILVRHGETMPARIGETFPTHEGHGDPPLGPHGHEQAAAVGERLRQEEIHALYVTSLVRTHQTAHPLVAHTGLEPVVEHDLREIYLGEWEGGEFRIRGAKGDPLFAQMLREERWDVIPGAERDEAFTARLADAVDRIHRRHPDQRVVAVVHGGVIGSLLAAATGARPFAFVGADNGSISRLIIQGQRWSLRSYNDVTHLAHIDLG